MTWLVVPALYSKSHALHYESNPCYSCDSECRGSSGDDDSEGSGSVNCSCNNGVNVNRSQMCWWVNKSKWCSLTHSDFSWDALKLLLLPVSVFLCVTGSSSKSTGLWGYSWMYFYGCFQESGTLGGRESDVGCWDCVGALEACSWKMVI